MDDQDDRNISKFPDEGARREKLILRAANDGGRKNEPALNLPPAVKVLCLLMIFVFLGEKALPFFIGDERTDALIYTFGFVPARYTGGAPLGVGGIVSPVTHMFVHGGWLHLAINVLSLMAFGAGLEKWMGWKKLLVVFFLTGFAGAFCQFALSPHLDSPMIGASGAISGLFGALLVEMRNRGVLQSNGRNPLLIFAVVWVVTALFFGAFGVPGAPGPISWATHIGGFIAGMVLAGPVARMKI